MLDAERTGASTEPQWNRVLAFLRQALFVHSDDERFVREWLDAKVRQLAPAAELWVIPAGSAHATDLLAADSTLAARLTDWLRRRLAS